MQQVKCRARMESLYGSLGDFEAEDDCVRECRRLVNDMDIICAVCKQPIGDKADKLGSPSVLSHHTYQVIKLFTSEAIFD